MKETMKWGYPPLGLQEGQIRNHARLQEVHLILVPAMAWCRPNPLTELYEEKPSGLQTLGIYACPVVY